MTPDQLRHAIANAEQVHMNNGFVVEIATDNLNEVIQKQITSRRKLLALRALLIAAEKEAACVHHSL